MLCLALALSRNEVIKTKKRCSGAPCTYQRSLHCILAQCPITASSTHVCLLCCQPARSAGHQLPGHHNLHHEDLADYLLEGGEPSTCHAGLKQKVAADCLPDWGEPSTCHARHASRLTSPSTHLHDDQWRMRELEHAQSNHSKHKT